MTTIKNWVLGQLHGAGRVVGRPDLAPREPTFSAAASGRSSVEAGDSEHLGAYAALVGAVRDEFEHFVASHVRLHLSIAERDRFMLTAIGVRCSDAASATQARALLDQFMREFRPEQIKRFLAREVIAALPNAAAIDLSQFAGLYDADARDSAAAPGEYAELIAALNITPAAARAYEVSIVGRWSEAADAPRPHGTPPSVAGATLATLPFVRGATPVTPLAGQRVEFELEDADGRRRVVLPAVLPGRRYVIGKGEGCELRANGTYTSRRHAELWRDGDGAWWVGDAGSTNGVRVEARGEEGAALGIALTVEQPLRLPDGARIVLSARAEGPASDYPWLALRAPAAAAALITPIAAALRGGADQAADAVITAAPRTPLTAILLPPAPAWRIDIEQGGSLRTVEVSAAALPFTVGRSRNQALVIDRRHDGVSGHHLEITAFDDDGAAVSVHGDNGVQIGATHHPAGSELHWRAGQALRLGAAGDDDDSHCTLTLQHATGWLATDVD